MSKVKDLHRKWSRDTEYRAAYDEQGPEFELTRALIETWTGAGLTQAQLAGGGVAVQARRLPSPEEVAVVPRTEHPRPPADAGGSATLHRHGPPHRRDPGNN